MGVAWRSVIDSFIGRHTGFIGELCRRGSSTGEHPIRLPRLGLDDEALLLETYGRGPAVPVEIAAATLADVWQRTLFSSRIVKPPNSNPSSGAAR